MPADAHPKVIEAAVTGAAADHDQVRRRADIDELTEPAVGVEVLAKREESKITAFANFQSSAFIECLKESVHHLDIVYRNIDIHRRCESYCTWLHGEFR